MTEARDRGEGGMGFEQRLLLEAVYQLTNLDFRGYAPASMRRRILGRIAAEQAGSVSGLIAMIRRDAECLGRLVEALTVHVTSMFRDPSFYVAFRQRVVPLLRTYPFARIWDAGCSTGEEVYSIAILLREEGLADRCRIYATDVSDAVIDRARAAVFPLSTMREHTEAYQKAGGVRSFSEYYTARLDHAIMAPSLKDNIVFAAHNLVTDASFNEFQVVLCRNVMIYFDKTLQERAHGLFHQSLCRLGVLALGRGESLRFTSQAAHYEAMDEQERIFRKIS